MKVTNTALGILGSRFLRRPFYARVHVTYRCNYRCRMCGIDGIRKQFAELGQDAFDRVAQQLRILGARHVVITGGEPFLRNDLAGIVGAFARRKFSVRVQTNGGPHVTRERLAEVARAGAADLSVSVDTLDGALQDRISGGRGTLDHALRTLALALELMPRGMSLANIVASPHNFTELPALVRHFGASGIYSYITPAVVITGAAPAGGDYLFRGQDDSFGFAGISPGNRDGVIDELVALRRQGWGLTNSTRHLRDFQRFLATGRSAWTCASGTFALDVRPDGSVSACKEKPPLGHILDPSFAESYRSGAFRRQADAQAASCSGCFYGEYREPSYAIRDGAVLREWIVDWLRTFRKGMGWKHSSAFRSQRRTSEAIESNE
jgi:MoaA/NifB/PqqE/SkfB family radical SAM enzyme